LFSPNGDGVKDRAVFRIQVGAQENLVQWTYEITSVEGKLLATFTGPGAPPPTLEWDGKDLTGRLVPDGAYRYGFSVVTKAGVQSRAPTQEIIVDRVKPEVAVSVSPELFSPNGDGVKDEAVFKSSASDATGLHSWVLEIKDKDGLVVKHFGAEGVPSAAVVWDGRGSFETDVPDGAYTFQLTAQDIAGNSASTIVGTVSINRLALVSEVQASPRIFSPNVDGVKDEVVISIRSASPDTVESWVLQILNRNGKPAQEFSGRGPAPLRLVWTGKTEAGSPLPDGPYQLVLVETDRAGNRARSSPQVCELDNTPPSVEARLEPVGLSPNGDGVQDEGVFLVKVGDEHTIELWSLQVFNDVGVSVRRSQGTGLPTGRIAWKADDDGGRTLLDGNYAYALTARDVAGNAAATPRGAVRIDQTPPAVTLSASPALFSPNGDGILDTATLQAGVEDAGPLQIWELTIRPDAAGLPAV
ncbi:MAG: gliding motility-associated C-terminal domain-containing protein, partial [bacterium]